MKRIISATMAAVMLIASCITFIPEMTLFAAEPIDHWDGTADTSWYGDGSASSYEITTPEALCGLYEVVKNGDNFEGKTVSLKADIYLNSDYANYSNWSTSNAPLNKWKPIGGENGVFFKGTFDGEGHTVYGMYTESAVWYGAGLFAAVHDATVKNLKISSFFATAISSHQGAGALAGYARGSKVVFDNIVIEKGTVTADTTFSNGKVGAILGQIDNTEKHSSSSWAALYDITNSRVANTVTVASGKEADYVGGMVGSAHTSNSNGITLTYNGSRFYGTGPDGFASLGHTERRSGNDVWENKSGFTWAPARCPHGTERQEIPRGMQIWAETIRRLEE